jgi:Protein of unknown function (DUF3800)
MYLLYTDESGKSGLRDPIQPYHALGGVVVHDSDWLAVERDLMGRIDALVPPPRVDGWELHMTDIWNGKGFCRRIPRATREALWGAVLDVIDAHRLTLFMMVIDKAAHVQQYAHPQSPESLVYEFMIERFDRFLHRQGDRVGMVVADEAKGQEDTIRAAHASYRASGTSQQSIHYVVETPFFVPSHYSVMLQLIDVATWWCTRTLRTAPSRDIVTGSTTVAEWGRLRQWLDVAPSGQIVGFKIFP